MFVVVPVAMTCHGHANLTLGRCTLSPTMCRAPDSAASTTDAMALRKISPVSTSTVPTMIRVRRRHRRGAGGPGGGVGGGHVAGPGGSAGYRPERRRGRRRRGPGDAWVAPGPAGRQAVGRGHCPRGTGQDGPPPAVCGDQAQQGEQDANHAVHLLSRAATDRGMTVAARYTVAG